MSEILELKERANAHIKNHEKSFKDDMLGFSKESLYNLSEIISIHKDAYSALRLLVEESTSIEVLEYIINHNIGDLIDISLKKYNRYKDPLDSEIISENTDTLLSIILNKI